MPKILFRVISPHSRKFLLLKLQMKSLRGVKHPRDIFIHAKYGLGNLVRALRFALVFARRTDRVLVIILAPEQHLNFLYTDLFVSNDGFLIADNCDGGEEWPIAKNNVSDWEENVKWYKYASEWGQGELSQSAGARTESTSSLRVNLLPDAIINDAVDYPKNWLWNFLRALTPQINVIRVVEGFWSYPMYEMIGIHIRNEPMKCLYRAFSDTFVDYSCCCCWRSQKFQAQWFHTITSHSLWNEQKHDHNLYKLQQSDLESWKQYQASLL